MDKYVIFNSEMKIVNIVLWDGNLSLWQPPNDCTYIKESEVDLSLYKWLNIDNIEDADNFTQEFDV
jgi:hypothetical protein